MAKITIVGDALCITSSVKWADLELVAQYRPNALILTEGEEKVPVFKVTLGKTGEGEVGKYGIVFTGKTHDDDGFATFTQEFRFKSERDIKEVVAEYIGTSILNLNKIEEAIPGVLAEIATEKASIMENITIA